MSINVKLISDLQKLLGLEPSLVQKLKEADSLDEAIEHIIAAASRHGISLNAGELKVGLRTVAANMTEKDMTDEQLADVTGGITPIFVLEFIKKTIDLSKLF